MRTGKTSYEGKDRVKSTGGKECNLEKHQVIQTDEAGRRRREKGGEPPVFPKNKRGQRA